MEALQLPTPQDPTDEAVFRLFEYLALSSAVEPELEGLRPAIRRVLLELLIADEASERLTSFRASVLAFIRAPRVSEGAVGLA